MNLAVLFLVAFINVQMLCYSLFATLRGSPFVMFHIINLKVVPQDQIAAIDPKPYKSARHSIFITEKSFSCNS